MQKCLCSALFAGIEACIASFMTSPRRVLPLFHRSFSSIVLGAALVGITTLATAGAEEPPADLKLAPQLEKLPTDRMGPFVKLPDGAYLTVDGTFAFISRDEGKTWTQGAAILPKEGFQISNERALLRKKNGTLVLAFMNLATRGKQYWVKETNSFPADINLETWAVRSTDDGKTWKDAQCIAKGYCGAIRSMVEAADGTIVLGAQNIALTPAHHVLTGFTSPDDGHTWHPSSFTDPKGNKAPQLDLGGHGHHDGLVEPTLITLKDGRIWMLVRTGLDYFLEIFSSDSGVTWGPSRFSQIDASAAPGMLHRMADGRILLVWNRLYPEGKTEYPRRGLPWHTVPASYHREELSLAFSSDEGATWSTPKIVARRDSGKWVSYPYLFEPSPGHLWLTTMQGGLRAHFKAADFAAGK
jgi:hypothetical protein